MASIGMSLEYCMPVERLYNPQGMNWILGKSMKNITPEEFRCVSIAGCPAVYDLEDGRLLIIGKIPSQDDLSSVKEIGNDELAIVIDAELVSKALADKKD